jgi:hypothetical protein
MASCYREARAYRRDAANVQATQSAWLLRMVERQKDTWFGRKHRFAAVRSVLDFQDAVPLFSYDDYRPAIERIGNGESNVLTLEPVRSLEPTGGSVSGEKLIPYSDPLRANMQRAIRAWIWDLYSRRPALRQGRSYWSITPLVQPGRKTSGGIPIGFDDDLSYLSRVEQSLVAKTMAAPPEIARSSSVAAALYATLFFLLRAGDLSLISVWSPTFLVELLRYTWERRGELCDDISAGRISAGPDIEPKALFRRRYRPLFARAAYLRRVFSGAENVSQCISNIWPSLSLVSCWADGPSFAYANHLRGLLPGIEIQPKGLLATEAFVTFPLIEEPAPALAIRSHFFEFQPIDRAAGESTSRPLLAHELERGRRYRVVVTNGGGLYRYHLNDAAEVAGFRDQVPLLTFVGKTDDVSDLVGEKLHAAQVQTVLRVALRELGLTPTFVQLRAERSERAHYRLLIADANAVKNPQMLERLRCLVEEGLNANPAYRYARCIGQLGAIEVESLDHECAQRDVAAQIADSVASGRRSGDIKPAVLIHRTH